MSLGSKLKQSRSTGQGILTLLSRQSGLLIHPIQGWHLISLTPPRCPSLSAGLFSSSLLIRSLMLSLSPSSEGNSTASPRILALVSLSDELWWQKGGQPTTISQRRAPRQQQSTSKEWPSRVTISGLMYSRLPQQEQRFSRMTLARPKSAMRRCPWRSIMMFSGLRSRQTMLFECRCSIASNTSMKYPFASSSENRSSRLCRWKSSPPGQQSMTITQCCQTSKNSRICTRKGKATISLTLRSFSISSSFPLSFCFSTNLAAQNSPSLRSLHRNTLLNPPTPMLLSMSQAVRPDCFSISLLLSTTLRAVLPLIHPSLVCSLQSVSRSPLRVEKQAILLGGMARLARRHYLRVSAGQGQGTAKVVLFSWWIRVIVIWFEQGKFYLNSLSFFLRLIPNSIQLEESKAPLPS